MSRVRTPDRALESTVFADNVIAAGTVFFCCVYAGFRGFEVLSGRSDLEEMDRDENVDHQIESECLI